MVVENGKCSCECGNDQFAEVRTVDDLGGIGIPGRYVEERGFWCILCSALHVNFTAGEKRGTWERREHSARAGKYVAVPA